MPARRQSDDRALVARANRGDPDAFASLYRAYRDWVVRLAFRFTANQEDALDVLQETFIYLYSKFPGLCLTTSIPGFLYPVVKHQSITILRRRKTLVDLDQYRRGKRGCAELAGGERVLWAMTEGEDHADRAARLVESLPEKQREVVLLRYGLGFQYQEIADSLAIPLGTVRSRLHHALRWLRLQLCGSESAKVKERPERRG